MKSLGTLLRLAKRDVDLLKRALADQIGKQIAVEERIRGQERILIAEQKASLRDYESYRAFSGYAIVAASLRQSMEGELTAIGQECDRLRGLIAAAHVEMRKFERLLELQAERERKAADKREADELDELATQRAGRRMANGE